MRLKSRRIRNTIAILFVILNLLIPLIVIFSGSYLVKNGTTYNSKDNENYSESSYPKVQGFTKDVYLNTEILELDQNPVGMINVTDLSFKEEGIYKYNFTFFGEFNNDTLSEKLNISYKKTEFIKTLRPAKFEKLNEEIMGAYDIQIQLNESISVQYDDSQDDLDFDYFIYLQRLKHVHISQLWIENDTLSLRRVGENNYTIEEDQNREFLKFYYRTYFNNDNKANFTLHIICEFNLTIDSWELVQNSTPELLITDEDDNDEDIYVVSPRYKYSFNVIGNKYVLDEDAENEDAIYTLPTDNLWVNLTVYPTDKGSLYGHRLVINGKQITEKFRHPDKSIYTETMIRTNLTSFELEFSTNFVIEFVDPVDYTWAIDRLVEDQDIRERIYFPKIVSGPSRIILKNVKIFEETVSFEQVISASSLFRRPVLYVEINVSEYEEELKNSLIFHEFATKRQGIRITLPYMIQGEICPTIIKYETTNDLKIVVTDNIGMPLGNYEVRLYYYGEKFGTYISDDETQPLGPLITDQFGEVLVKDAPNGNYTVKIFPKDSENMVVETEVSVFVDINYVKTSVIHFPILILIFGGITGIILILGLKIYPKREKTQIT